MNDLLQQAKLYAEMGEDFVYAGEKDKALDCYEKAALMYESASPICVDELLDLYGGIKSLYHNKKNFEKVLEYELKAIRLVENMSHRSEPFEFMLATMYRNIAGTYCKVNNYEIAHIFIEKAIAIYQVILKEDHLYLENSRWLKERIMTQL
ncbi:MAG: tetratricopeptide repeat protein [Bacteroidia bacterium]